MDQSPNEKNEGRVRAWWRGLSENVRAAYIGGAGLLGGAIITSILGPVLVTLLFGSDPEPKNFQIELLTKQNKEYADKNRGLRIENARLKDEATTKVFSQYGTIEHRTSGRIWIDETRTIQHDPADPTIREQGVVMRVEPTAATPILFTFNFSLSANDVPIFVDRSFSIYLYHGSGLTIGCDGRTRHVMAITDTKWSEFNYAIARVDSDLPCDEAELTPPPSMWPELERRAKEFERKMQDNGISS